MSFDPPYLRIPVCTPKRSHARPSKAGAIATNFGEIGVLDLAIGPGRFGQIMIRIFATSSEPHGLCDGGIRVRDIAGCRLAMVKADLLAIVDNLETRVRDTETVIVTSPTSLATTEPPAPSLRHTCQSARYRRSNLQDLKSDLRIGTLCGAFENGDPGTGAGRSGMLGNPAVSLATWRQRIVPADAIWSKTQRHTGKPRARPMAIRWRARSNTGRWQNTGTRGAALRQT